MKTSFRLFKGEPPLTPPREGNKTTFIEEFGTLPIQKLLRFLYGQIRSLLKGIVESIKLKLPNPTILEPPLDPPTEGNKTTFDCYTLHLRKGKV